MVRRPWPGCGTGICNYSKSGRSWLPPVSRRAFWMRRPSAPSAAAAVIWEPICASVFRSFAARSKKREVSILSGASETFHQFRLDYYPDTPDAKYGGASPRAIMERNFKVARTFGLTFAPSSGNLLFNGGTGLGKTFLSACIARAVADRGYSVVYETANRLFSKLEQAKFSPNEENRREAAQIQSCDLLILDDLGTEMPSQFVTAALYSLLSDRLLDGKSMVISTNLNVEEISRRYNPQIASRLQGEFKRLTFVGEDIRILKNRGV